MIFLGQSFYGDDTTKLNPVDMDEITSIKLQNGIYDELYVSKDVTQSNNITDSWDYSTILYAAFQNDLLAGNLGFAIDTITAIRIKKREYGELDWMNIEDISINSIEDLKFIYTYAYCKGNTEYEFAVVPILNDTIEGNLNIINCKSEFNGAYLLEKDVAVHMLLNLKMNTQRNQNATTVQTLGRKKPFYIANGTCDYTSGDITVSFVGINDECKLQEKTAKYRDKIDNILSDKKPKVLKMDDGRMWIVGIVDSIPQADTADGIMPIHTINWTEIADCDDPYDMFINGFHNIYY